MPDTATAGEIESWLIERVVAYGKVSRDDFDEHTPLTEIGLDSVYALTLCGDIEDQYGLDVDPTIVWDYDTLEELAKGLSTQLAER